MYTLQHVVTGEQRGFYATYRLAQEDRQRLFVFPEQWAIVEIDLTEEV